ncbi:hypothetical protein XENTR_v10005376 [Xenopus tropicalis]|nr:hypothetical protein XENTR_v10005376 [Xenopus tropicalis]
MWGHIQRSPGSPPWWLVNYVIAIWQRLLWFTYMPTVAAAIGIKVCKKAALALPHPSNLDNKSCQHSLYIQPLLYFPLLGGGMNYTFTQY